MHGKGRGWNEEMSVRGQGWRLLTAEVHTGRDGGMDGERERQREGWRDRLREGGMERGTERGREGEGRAAWWEVRGKGSNCFKRNPSKGAGFIRLFYHYLCNRSIFFALNLTPASPPIKSWKKRLVHVTINTLPHLPA